MPTNLYKMTVQMEFAVEADDRAEARKEINKIAKTVRDNLPVGARLSKYVDAAIWRV